MDYKFTIVVPVYNEEDNLERVESELLEYSKKASVATCILFVNDGSKDRSQELIEAICNRNPNFNYISFKENRGLSAAIKAGFDYTETELVGYIDSDLQTAPEDFTARTYWRIRFSDRCKSKSQRLFSEKYVV